MGIVHRNICLDKLP